MEATAQADAGTQTEAPASVEAPAAAAPSTEGLISQDKANAMVASARKKLESKNAEMSARLTEMQEQFEDLQQSKSGKPDVERQMEKLQAKLKAAQETAAAAQADALNTKKGMAMAKINAEIGWADGIGQEAREALVNAKFSGLDLDDLTDADVVAPLVTQFRESNPWAVNGSAAAGAGAKPGTPASSGGTKEYSSQALIELAKTDSVKHAETMKTVWAEVANGKAKLVA